MFWDGESSPSVEVPIGDFFGVGFGLRRNFVSLPLQMSPQDGLGFNCWFPMPFADGARFEVENQGERERILFFYVDCEADRDVDGGLCRLRAWWNRNNPAAGTARAQGYPRKEYKHDDQRPVGAGFAADGRWKEAILTGARNYVILDASGAGHY